MGEIFDPDKLRLGSDITPQRRATRPSPIRNWTGPELPRHGSGERFLKGPIPLSWLAVAAGCSGRALHAALLIWYRAFLTRGQPVKIPAHDRNLFGLDRKSLNRAVSALECAGLVRVERKAGNSPRITILDPED